MNELNIPRWNVDSLFSSIDSDKYKDALSSYQTAMEKLENLLKTSGRFNFCFWLKGFLEEKDRVDALCQTLNAYAYIMYSTDTTDSRYLNNLAFLDELSLRQKKIEINFSTTLAKNSKKLDEFFERFPDFAGRKFLLEEHIAEAKHQMTAKKENLAGELQRTGGNAWGRLQEQIISNLKDENGKTFNELRNDAYSFDPELRRDSYLKEIQLLKENEIALAACLNNLKGETLALNSYRKWKQPLDRALFSNRLNKKTLQAMIKAVEKSMPEWRKYFLVKAKYLRANQLTVSSTLDSKGNLEKGLAFFDLFAPLSKNNPSETDVGQSLFSKKWSFDEAKKYIIQKYESFSSDMGIFAQKVFDEHWIDAEIRPGKVGGAYDEDFALGHQSRILTNFTGAFSDVITLAHEIGHAYHFSCLKGKPACFFSYPMTLAETASTFAETIVKQDMIRKSSEKDKIQLLDMDLQDAAQVLVDILCRYYFEKQVFEERKNGELTAADFCRIMEQAQEKTYGRALNSSRHPYMWALKSHYYSTELDFYNFPYAFGQLFAAGLYSRFQKEGKSFAKTYRTLLSDTGGMNCEELCQKNGFDITAPDFWKSGIEMYVKEIDEFISMTKGKSTAVTIKAGSTPKTIFETSKPTGLGLLKRAERLQENR